MSFATFLPAPRQVQVAKAAVASSKSVKAAVAPSSSVTENKKGIPPYGSRSNWVPHTQEDFGDGGAYPEVHVSQYPLGMGKDTTVGGGTLNTVPFLAQQEDNGKMIQRRHSDTQETLVKEDEMTRPDADEEKEATERTRVALERLVTQKSVSVHPSNAVESGNTQYVQFTPSSQGTGDPGKQRMIRITTMAQDPLDPPKFKHKKVPGGPPSPPVPIMHSPPRKVTPKDQQDWKIPPCISNWKNNKGYTIPLDKRLAADGRGLQEVVVNDNFARLAESLYLAERNAREEVSKRAEIERRLKLKEKEKKEEMLRKLAQEAREERLVSMTTSHDEDNEELEARRERDQIREERRRERERELRLQRSKSALLRNADRDVTEKIALGMAMPERASEVAYDQRLFNQSQGMDSGFGDDENYNIYTKPLFQGSSANQIYRPKKGEDSETYGSESDYNKLLDTSKFRPDKGFTGTESEDGKKGATSRSGPVQFEKTGGQKEDPFGLDEFLSQAKTQSSQKKPLDKIGQGSMHAATTSAGSAHESVGSKRTRISFESSSSSSHHSSSSSHHSSSSSSSHHSSSSSHHSSSKRSRHN